MTITVVPKKWGNSLAIIIPKEKVNELNIKENKPLLIDILKPVDLSDIFGSLKIKMSGQKFKDFVRQGSM
ncbi:MAG TPA: AbrB/MazE/SpoVT family DNA-binding domain-containing protein [Candidatus Nanoarchaeia archaeon]|nr:AbrB/MazE/SpoVT family DNA-binding domain-containing protein [Candidatus Nanoarchaeia archaeon]